MLKLPKFSLKNNNNQPTSVSYRNTLLEVLFPEVDFRIVSVETNADCRERTLATLSRPIDGFKLDFASGARKHGDFILSNAEPSVASEFFDTAEKAIAYGGMLVTECREVFSRVVRVLVVEDGAFATGDCHGKASDGFLEECRLLTDQAIQFRLAVRNPAGDGRGHIAKGTLAVAEVPDGIDLVLPVSSFKSFVPILGQHEWRVAFGIVSIAEPSKTRVSYQIIQWFSPETIDADVWPRTQAVIALLRAVSESTEAAVEYFRLDDEGDEDSTDVSTQVLHRLLKADTHGRLTFHPYVIDRIARHLRRRWMECATGGGLRWTGLMGLPDDRLPDGVVCAPSLPEGHLICTRYPIRSYADLKLVRNIHSLPNAGIPSVFGSVWLNHRTAAAVAGDFDGDRFLFAPASEYPSMTAEIRTWGTRPAPPVVKCKDRLASPLDLPNLAKVALDNVDNPVGLISYLTAAAIAQNRLDLVLRLAVQLQIAVDRFKYSLALDEAFIDAVGRQLEVPAWLADLKADDVFTRRSLSVDTGATDTISHLARKVVDGWRSPKLLQRPLVEFVSLFPPLEKHPGTEKLREAATELVIRYARKVAESVERGGKDAFRSVVAELRQWADSRRDKERWASALWHAAHGRLSKGTASAAFQAFPEEIVGRLGVRGEVPDRIVVVGLEQNGSTELARELDGRTVEARVCFEVLGDMVRGAVYHRSSKLGYLSSETPCEPGTYRTRFALVGKVLVGSSVSSTEGF